MGASAVPIQDGGNSITVDGTFYQATQPVSAASLPLPTGASTSALQTQPGVDIGDVTINNASGGSAVNIQDGGNSITVDGTVTVNALPTGTNNIGDVDVLTLPAIPTGTNSIGTVVDGGAGKTLKNVAVSLTASGNVVAAVASKMIKVYAYEIQSITDGMTVQLVDDLAGNLVSILWTLNAREGVMASAVQPPSFLFKNSAQNKPIYANITGTGTVKILARYWDDDGA